MVIGCRLSLSARNVCQWFGGCLTTGSSTLERHRTDEELPGRRLTALDNVLKLELESILLSMEAHLSLFCSPLKLLFQL